MQRSIERERKYIDFRFSLGIVLKEDATVRDVVPGSAAAKAGIGPGMKLIAVNGRQYSKEGLRTALRNGKTSSAPMELLVANGEFYATYPVDYHGGERYPHLERDPSNPDLLSVVISPIVVKGKSGK
jgi:predicted metalloprotease with PDZ domain